MIHDLYIGQPTVLRHWILLCVYWISGEYMVRSWKGLSCCFAGAIYLKHRINISISVFYLEEQGSFAIPIIELVLPTIHSILSWRWLSVVQLASLWALTIHSVLVFICFTFCSVLVFFHKSSIVCGNREKIAQNWTELFFIFPTDSATSDSAKSKVNNFVKW